MATLVVDALTEFFDAIRSPITKDRYEKRLDIFFKYVKISGATLRDKANAFAPRAKRDPQWAAASIADYMRYQKVRAEKGEISESTVPQFYKPIKLFCDMNDILLNWKKITRGIPKGRRYGDDRAPSVEELKAILAYPDRRIKAVVLTASSGGLRNGAWDYLKWGHVTPIEQDGRTVAAKVQVYVGTPDAYFTFITPEAYAADLDYVKYRESCGERISRDSPLIRDLFVPDRGGKGEPHMPLPLKSSGVKRMLEDSLKATGLWKPLEVGKRRHEFQATHGLRKFYKSVCERHMKSLHVEMLMGHDVGLAENYYRPSEKELLADYLRAVGDLTLMTSVQQEHSASDLVAALSTQNSQLQEQVKVLSDRLGRAEAVQTQVQEKQKRTDEIMNQLFLDPEFKLAVKDALEKRRR
ncbi:MAG: hypothetical protein OK438_04350 [Thaumarchaeota archaeon]|nr:hypothetical protein [Nitrososphaerota archaeon]